MARDKTIDTVVDNGVEEQSGEKAERSEHNLCEMCRFLYVGYRSAHSKQAKAEYGEGFLNHFTRFHRDVFGEI